MLTVAAVAAETSEKQQQQRSGVEDKEVLEHETLGLEEKKCEEK